MQILQEQIFVHVGIPKGCGADSLPAAALPPSLAGGGESFEFLEVSLRISGLVKAYPRLGW